MMAKLNFKVFSIFFLFIPVFPISALEFALSAEPYISYSKGSIDECLYDNSSTGRMLSALEWDKNIVFFGIKPAFSLESFHFNSDFALALPGNCGQMQDSDWMNDSQPQMKTTYSVGDNKVLVSFKADLDFSFDVISIKVAGKKVFTLSPMVSFYYAYDSFKRESAEGWYGQALRSSDGGDHWWYEKEAAHFPNTYWNPEKGRYVTQKLAGISYSQYFYSFYLGPSLFVRVSERFSLCMAFLLSPYSYSDVLDIHHGSENKYHQVGQSYWNYKKMKISGEFKISRLISSVVFMDATFSNFTKGSLSVNGVSVNSYKTASRQVSFLIGAGIKFNFISN